MDENWIRKFISLLEKERDVLGQLSAITEQKTAVMANGEIARLDGILNDEQPLIMQLESMENARLGMLSESGMDGLTLSEIAQKAEGTLRETLLGLLDSFTEVTVKIRTVNELNEKIARTRMEFYDALKGLRDKGLLYAPCGKKQEGGGTVALIDQKV